MGNEELEKRRESRRRMFLEWEIEKDLPSKVGPYVLKRIDYPTKEDREKDRSIRNSRIYTAFAWEDADTGWQVKAIFDEETEDYMIKMDLKLVSMTQVEAITGDFALFKKYVAELTPRAIEKNLIDLDKKSVLLNKKGFMKWDYKDSLPETIGHYKRIIRPTSPLHGLNGSYIIGAYECKEKNIGALFFYNVYRDEYYGELRAGGIPVIVHQYDSKTVEEFEENLKKNLERDLEYLYNNPEVDD